MFRQQQFGQQQVATSELRRSRGSPHGTWAPTQCHCGRHLQRSRNYLAKRREARAAGAATGKRMPCLLLRSITYGH